MIAVILKGWPRLSETFIAREMEALEARAQTLSLWSLRRPTDKKRHPAHDTVKANVTYLPEYLHEAPWRVFRAWRKWRWSPGYTAAKKLFAADWKRDRTRNRIRRFGQALVLATELPPETKLLYAHFIHTPGSVARYAAALTGLPYAVSAHARDIWTTPSWDLKDKLESARFVTTCTDDGFRHLQTIGAPHLSMNRHGLDMEAWPPAPPRTHPDGSDADAPVQILSVGRAVEKKGFDTLLRALALLPEGLHWRFMHVGGGALLPHLKELAAALEIERQVVFAGAQSEDAVRSAMRSAHIFALTPEIAADGDRDGLPNVLVEAQSQSLPVVSTSVGGVEELVRHGETGLIAAPGNAAAIAEALAQLMREPELRERMGQDGNIRVRTFFQAGPSADQIVRLLRSAMM